MNITAASKLGGSSGHIPEQKTVLPYRAWLYWLMLSFKNSPNSVFFPVRILIFDTGDVEIFTNLNNGDCTNDTNSEQSFFIVLNISTTSPFLRHSSIYNASINVRSS
jgi:hypothetical protein